MNLAKGFAAAETALETSYEAANEYLETQYLPEHNRRFSRLAAKPQDYHGRRKPTARELRQIFRLETERTISNYW